MIPDALLVAIKKSALAGPYGILAHCSRPQCRNGEAETSLADRLVHFEVGGSAFCGMTTPPRSAKLLSKIIAGAYKGGRRSQFTYRQIVLSVADTPESRHEEILEKLKLAVEDYRAKYLSGCPAWAAFYHADKSHVHCHVIACNWDDITNSLLNWSRRDIIQMNSLRWYQHEDFKPGANLYKREALEKRPKVYTKANTDLRGLIDEIKKEPDWKADVPARLKALEAEIDPVTKLPVLVPYRTESGNPGYVFRGRKITLAKINYELRQAESIYIGADGKQYSAPPQLRDEMEQQMLFDAQLGCDTGEDYKLFQDVPRFKLSHPESIGMMRSQMPANGLYRRHARTAVMRKGLFGDNCDDLGLAIKPLMKAFDFIASGSIKAKHIPKNSFLSFVCEVLAAANGFPNLSALLKPIQGVMDVALAVGNMGDGDGMGDI